VPCASRTRQSSCGPYAADGAPSRHPAVVGHPCLETTERASCRASRADRSTARALRIAPGTPVMQVRRIAQTFGDRPVEYRVSTIDTARHDYVHLLSRPGGSA